MHTVRVGASNFRWVTTSHDFETKLRSARDADDTSLRRGVSLHERCVRWARCCLLSSFINALISSIGVDQ